MRCLGLRFGVKVPGACSGPGVALVLRTSRDPKASQSSVRQAKFHIGQIVKHRIYPFRGVIYDVDPVFDNTEEWWLSIPEKVRPPKDQPFYHLLAENRETTYIAYVSEQNLLPDDSGGAVSHPQVDEIFSGLEDGRYIVRDQLPN